MKKLSILFLSVLALGITVASCSKEETAPTTTAFEGKWSFATIQALDSANQPTGDIAIFTGINGVDATCTTKKNDALTFNAANNGVYTDYPTNGCTPTDVPFTYAKTGNALSIDLGGETPLAAEIMSVTSTDLKLKIDYNGTDCQLTLKRS